MPQKTQNRSSLMEKLQQSKKTTQRAFSKSSSGNDIYNQSFIPIRDIVGNVCFLNDGTILSILEILPINFVEKSNAEKDNIADLFGMSFKQFPKNGHIKVMNSRANLNPFIRNVISAMSNETDPRIRQRVDDYIQHTKQIQKSNSVRKRFFFIYEYEGDEKGKKSDVYEEIMDQMAQSQISIINAFKEMGNIAIPLEYDSIGLAEVLFQYFNPKSSETDSFQHRQQKVNTAVEYCKENGTGVTMASYADYVAGRGISFHNNYVFSDGVFTTYLVLKDISHPKESYAGWLDRILDELPNGDMDIFYKQQNSNLNSFLFDRVNVISSALSLGLAGNEEKQSELVGKAANAKYIKSCIDKDGEDLYEVCIILTLRANSYKQLMGAKNMFLKKMKTYQFSFEDCYKRTQCFYKSTLPFSYVDDIIFESNKRNYTNSSLSTLYCFTTYESFDPTGYVMGINVNNGTLNAFNNFSSRYINPHIFILGSTGAGKTYTELMLSSRMRMMGIRTMFILPLKGHEYRPTIESLGGSFISLRPGGKACINICEIRPEAGCNLDALDPESIKRLEEMPSVLAKKIVSLTTWFQLLLRDGELTDEESGELDICLTRVYKRFGITSNNNSIWADAGHRKLKNMPILSDVYEEIKDNPSLKRITSVLKIWVEGNCSNMNGQTNVDLQNKTLAFDVNEDLIGKKLLPAFMYIAFDICQSIAKSNDLERCVLNLDETWKMLVIKACAEQIYENIKILRGYGTCVVSATQDIEDCTHNEYGKSLITLSAIKIFLYLDDSEIKTLGELFTLSERNRQRLQKHKRGYGFICANTEQEYIYFYASELEDELYTTDVERKKMYKERRQRSMNTTT